MTNNKTTNPFIIAAVVAQVDAKCSGIAFDHKKKLGTRDNFGHAETITAPLRKRLQHMSKSSSPGDSFAIFLGEVHVLGVANPVWAVGFGPFTTTTNCMIVRIEWYSALEELKNYWELDTYEFPWDLDWLRAIGIDKIPDDDPTVNPFLS